MAESPLGQKGAPTNVANNVPGARFGGFRGFASADAWWDDDGARVGTGGVRHRTPPGNGAGPWAIRAEANGLTRVPSRS